MADRSPEVQDLEALLQELRDILRRKVAVDTRNGCFAALVDMYAGDGLARVGLIDDFTLTAATDS